jgi:putative peptidoglycan lipid II flippase
MSRLVKKGLGVALLAAVALACGLCRQSLVASAFGSGAIVSAFVVAETVPLLLLNMGFGSAVTGVVVPAFLAQKRCCARGQSEAWAFALRVAVVLLLASVALAAVVSLLCGPCVSMVAPELGPEARALAIRLLRYAVWTLPLFALATLAAALCDAHEAFLPGAWRGALTHLPSIAVLLVWAADLGAMALVLGLTGGAVLQLVAGMPTLWRLARPYRKDIVSSGWSALWPRRDELASLGKSYVPICVTHVLWQAFLLFDRSFSSAVGVAAVAQFFYAERVQNAVRSVVVGSVAVVFFPRLTRLWQQGGQEPRLALAWLRRASLALLAVTAPAAVVMGLCGAPLVSALFERGLFGSHDSQAVVQALSGLAPAVVGYGVLNLIDRVYILAGQAWRFAALLGLGLLADLAVKVALVPLGLFGVGLGTSVGVAVAASAALLWLPTRSK